MKIVVDNKIPYLKNVLEPFAEVIYVPGNEIAFSHIKDADALITRTRTKVNKGLLAGSAIKFVVSATIGFDHIDTKYLKEVGIPWENCPGCNADSATQYVISTLLTLAEKHNMTLKEKTIGIIGVGNVGSRVEKHAKALGMNVLLNDPPREKIEGSEKFTSIQQIQKKADFITFHVPLNQGDVDNTFHIADSAFFEEMKDSAMIINCSRGEIVNNNDLKHALRNTQIAGAALDVWENEPAFDKELLNCLDIGTFHIAGYSAEGKANGTSMSVEKICKFFNLPLENWYPTTLPSPKKEIIIDCTNKANQDIIKEAVDASYSVTIDDQLLRESPEKFEYLRGHYEHRREFPYFSLSLNTTNPELLQTLKSLGFHCKST